MRALWALAAGVAAWSGCTSSGEPTGIDLVIRYDPSLGLDRIAITATAGLAAVSERTALPAEARPLSATGEEGLLILLPDEVAGQPISVRVDGLVGEDVAASGRVDVLARSNRLVPAVVELGDPGVCGDGLLSADSEECDDANDESGDGCSETCGVEEGWVCSAVAASASRCTSCDGWDAVTTSFDACGEDGLPAPVAELVLDQAGVYTLDTGDGMLTAPDGAPVELASDEVVQPSGPTLRRVSVAGLTIAADATLRAVGSDALLVAVWGDATVAGRIDVSAQGKLAGPGGGLADGCDAADGGAAGDSGSGGGGGGGAGFGDDGADGGDGQGDAKGAKGAKGHAVDGGLSPLRGGCAGARGGDDDEGGGGGAGGGAAGAVQLSVRDRLDLGGSVVAAGGGGRGGARVDTATGGTGGGGGGTGGAIVLEARVVHLAAGAALCANGGAGGEGSAGPDAGADGADGTCTVERASSPHVVADGGDGGRGGAGDGKNGEAGKNGGGEGGGGGGGGGSVGRVFLRSVDALEDQGALLTPDPSS